MPPRPDEPPGAVKPGPILSPTEILTSDEWAWTAPVNLGSNVNSEHFDGAPELSARWTDADFQFRSARWRREPPPVDEYERPPDDAPWSTAVNLGSTVNRTEQDIGASLATDSLTLIYASDRPGGQGHWDLWRCTRSSRDDSWSEPCESGRRLEYPIG